LVAPSISAIGEYSITVTPETSGRKKFQRPRERAMSLRRADFSEVT